MPTGTGACSSFDCLLPRHGCSTYRGDAQDPATCPELPVPASRVRQSADVAPQTDVHDGDRGRAPRQQAAPALREPIPAGLWLIPLKGRIPPEDRIAGTGKKEQVNSSMDTTPSAATAHASSDVSGVSASVLTDEMLARFSARAAGYDRDNVFFTEDFEEMSKAGYLRLAVPAELGGFGLRLSDVVQEQRRLGYHAPATALAINMHLYWTGIAADLWRSGDTSQAWLLEAAARGDVFAAGHAEGGNDIPVLLSTTKAERVEGGYRFTGRKSFGSLSPVWTYLGIHGLDTADPASPKVVHAFMPRDTEGYRIEETWDVLGMRATRSDDTILEGAFVPDRYVVRVVPAGAAGIDQFVLAIFAWALLGFGNIYYGLARRAMELTIASVKTKRSMALSRPMSYHAEVQHRVAEMGLAFEAIGPHLDRVAEDWSNGVNHGAAWPLKIFAAKYHAVEAAWRIVDLALEVSGGFGIFKRGELERMFRDARLGRLHPANSMLTHEIVAKTLLGISPDETPRWG
jgi:alkylation response protein AidB-like acyl-CoA dehydrogenase